MTTIGDVISTLFAKYERQFHDEHLAALVTEVALAEVLRKYSRSSPDESSRLAAAPSSAIA